MSTLGSRRVVPLALAVLALSGGGFWWFGRTANEGTDRPPVYVALGASDAVGIGAQRPASEGWVPRLHGDLPGRTQLVNLGISGATLSDVIALELPVAIDARPTLVTLWPGVNDLQAGVTLETFRTQLDHILNQVNEGRASDDLVITILNIPDLRYVPAFAWRDPVVLDATVREWNIAIAEVADRHGARVVDLYGSSLELDEHPEYVSSDGFHPSSAGYARIAEITLATINATTPSAVR